MPVVDISPATAFAHLVRRAPRTTSIVCAGRALSATQVDADATHLAAVLAAGGVAPGDRVAYLGRNSPEALLLLLACARLGAVYVPVNFRLSAPEIRYVLRHCGAHTVLAEPEFAARCEPLTRTGAVRRWLLAGDGETGATAGPRPGWLRPGDVDVDVARERTGPVAQTFDDLAMLMYTSGTTGRPKGVMLTHGNLWWSSANVDAVFDTRTDDVTLAVAPMFHIGGLNAFALRTLVRGGTVLVRPTFDAMCTLADLAGGGVTTVFGVPTMFAAIARLPEFGATDLSTVRAAIVAGSAVPASLIHEYADRGMLLQQSWGMTETSPAATYLPAARTRDKAGSAGLPLPYTRIKLLDPAGGGEIGAPGRVGEIIVTGPNVTAGYWDDPDATRDAFTADGWLRTGDLAELDDEGFLAILGRRTAMINSGGENIYPAEVERALAYFPGITGVAVVGIPDPEWGETVVAVLECPDGAGPSLADIRSFAALRLARYKLPTRVVVAAALPRNAAGKIDHRALRSIAFSEARPASCQAGGPS